MKAKSFRAAQEHGMPHGNESKCDLDLTLEDLNAIKRHVPQRVINEAERAAIVEMTRGLFSGAIARIDEFVRTRRHWQRRPSVEHSRRLFGLDRPDSSLMKPRLEWKMSLSERIATETLAKLLNTGGAQARATRIEAFLRALGLGDPELGIAKGCLASAQVFSEVPAQEGRRIDLKFLWPDAQDRERVLVVEAKFDHVITDGQLRCYRKSTERSHRGADCHYLILALHESAMLAANRQDRDWRFCSWRDLWLRFEASRPFDDDLSLQLFLHALWRRIGQLSPKDAYAPL